MIEARSSTYQQFLLLFFLVQNELQVIDRQGIIRVIIIIRRHSGCKRVVLVKEQQVDPNQNHVMNKLIRIQIQIKQQTWGWRRQYVWPMTKVHVERSRRSDKVHIDDDNWIQRRCWCLPLKQLLFCEGCAIMMMVIIAAWEALHRMCPISITCSYGSSFGWRISMWCSS